MGRGRAKAKQTKVARELKYGGPQTDFDRLQAELAGSAGTHSSPRAGDGDAADDAQADDAQADDAQADDPYSKYYDESAD
jgi:hypothetical protein